MMLNNQWKEMSEKLYSQQPLGIRHSLVDDLELDSLGLPGTLADSERTLPGLAGRSFWSVNLGQKDIFSEEFCKRCEAALFINQNFMPNEELQSNQFYFASSTDLCSFKTDFMSRYENQKMKVHLGVEPYGLGLWQSLVWKSTIDLKILEMDNLDSLFRLSSLPYNLAGASEIQELAILLSGLIQLFEDYDGFLTPSQILSTTAYELALDSNFLAGVAKIQALQLLTARIHELESIDQTLSPIFCIFSPRFLSRREPWNNILRLTSAHMSACIGGAAGIVNLPYDVLSKAEGGRLSRNIDLILQQESYLNQVQQPTLGSHCVDTFVNKLCEKAWTFFQEIQSKGGLKASLRSGWLQEEIERNETEQKEKFRSRKMKIVGVNDFVLNKASDPSYPLLQSDQVLDVEAWWLGFQIDNKAEKLFEVKKLKPSLLSEKFERRQFFADSLRKESSEHVCFQLVREPNFDGNQKISNIKKILGLLGFDLSEEGPSLLGTIVVAADPESDFAKTYRDKHQALERPGLLLWGGEKNFPTYDGYVGLGTDLNELFSIIQKHCKETM